MLWVGRAASYKRPEVFLDLAGASASASVRDGRHFRREPPFGRSLRLRERSRHLPNVTLIEGASREEVEALFRARARLRAVVGGRRISKRARGSLEEQNAGGEPASRS